MHHQFNLMYMTTLMVAKNRHTIVSGPKFAGIAQFGNIANNRGDGGGGSTSGGGGGGKGEWWCSPPPEVDNESSSNDSEDK
jgi:hypothetical protein